MELGALLEEEEEEEEGLGTASFFQVPLRRVFGVVAAFTLMMQFACLLASHRRRVFHHRCCAHPYQSVTAVFRGPPGSA